MTARRSKCSQLTNSLLYRDRRRRRVRRLRGAMKFAILSAAVARNAADLARLHTCDARGGRKVYRASERSPISIAFFYRRAPLCKRWRAVRGALRAQKSECEQNAARRRGARPVVSSKN